VTESIAETFTSDSTEVRQLNTRLRADVYQVLKFLSVRRDLSVGKLAEQVLTEFAATCLAEAQEEARAAVAAAQRAAEALERIQLASPPPKSVTDGSRPNRMDEP
jgi:hypothetical protein